MLVELSIRNFAIIDDLTIRFQDGFHVLTGETGAGKSIILDAVMLILGGRADTMMIRAGAQEAYVEALFHIKPALHAVLAPLLTAEGLEDEGSDPQSEQPIDLLLAREIRANGRNISRINGRTVNLAILREIAEPLIDIHGQGEHLSLLHPKSHLPLLDNYARLEDQRKALGRQVAALQKVRAELQNLRQNERALAQRADMLRYRAEEIGAAKLTPGEEDDLRAERTRLANAEQLMRAASESVALLTGMDDESVSAADLLGQVERSLVQLTRYDDAQGPKLESLQGIIYQLSELSSDLQSYLDELEFNPGRLSFVEERLELIQSLKRKYGENIEEILALREKALAELKGLDNSETRLAELELAQEKLLAQVGTGAAALSEKRQAAAQTLATAVVTQLADLSMEGSRFEVQFRREPQADGAIVGQERFAYDQTGIDKVEFLISTNPGEPLKPMAKVASGGETARLMLALKTALAEVDITPTLIFDEIDQGIGGRIGDVVGQKLWGLAAVSNHQVIVVTHLPQLAGYGDVHFHVSKQVQDGRTLTHVENLEHHGRVRELAAMLGTSGQHAIGGAEAILQQAQHKKENIF